MIQIKPTKPKITVIVPYGHNAQQPEREKILHFVVENCLHRQIYTNLCLALVECSPHSSQKHYAKNNFDKYLFIQQKRGPFSVGQLQNIAIAQLNPQPYFYIHLPDFLLPINLIEKTLLMARETGAPCIFPFYGAVNLTKPITEGVLNKNVNWLKLMNNISKITSGASFRNNENLINHPKNPNRVQLTAKQIEIIDSVLPSNYKSDFLMSRCDDKDLWGSHSSEQFNFYGVFKSPGKDEALGNFRTGPRAKPSYLCNTDAFIKVGGTTVKKKGWNCEDLWFWERLRTTDKKYSIDNNGIYYDHKKLSGEYPVTHLWHDISVKLPYYRNAQKSVEEFNKFSALPDKDKLKIIKPLDVSKLKKCLYL